MMKTIVALALAAVATASVVEEWEQFKIEFKKVAAQFFLSSDVGGKGAVFLLDL